LNGAGKSFRYFLFGRFNKQHSPYPLHRALLLLWRFSPDGRFFGDEHGGYIRNDYIFSSYLGSISLYLVATKSGISENLNFHIGNCRFGSIGGAFPEEVYS
jgi:hypothetical protein